MRKILFISLCILCIAYSSIQALEIKKSATPKLPVILVNATDHATPTTGVTSPTVYYMVQDGSAAQKTSPTFAELDATNMKGLYQLTLDNTMTGTVGKLVVYVTKTGCDDFRAEVDVVDNLESDTYTIANTSNTTIATVNTTLGTVNTTLTAANSTIATANTTIASANTTIANANTTIGLANTTITLANTTVTNANTTIGNANTTVGLMNTTVNNINTTTGSFNTTWTSTKAGYLDAAVSSRLPTANITLVAGNVSVGTNYDKAGYTASTVSDKTGYTATVSDKTGFSLVSGEYQNISNITWANTTRTLTGTQAFNNTGNFTGNLSGSVGSVTGGVTVTTNNDKLNYTVSAAGIDTFWDEVQSGHSTAGSFGKYLDAQVSTIGGGSLTAQAVWEYNVSAFNTAGFAGTYLKGAGSAGDPWTTSIPGAYGAGTAGYIIGNNLNANISSRSTLTANDVWGNATRTITGGTITTNSDKTGYTASTVSDKTGYSLASGDYQNISNITWTNSTRTLTSGANIALAKGTGVTGFNDIDVWNASTRQLTGTQAFNLTGTITGNHTGNLSGSVGSVTSPVTAGTVSDKTGYNVSVVMDKTGYSLSAAQTFNMAGNVTGNLTGNVTGNVGGSVGSVTNGVTVTTNNDKANYTVSPAGIDTIWDEAIAGHLTAGTTGYKLNAAGGAGDPWDIDISTGYTGKAGELMRRVDQDTNGAKDGGDYNGIEKMVRTQR
jgi:hypothetical protein